MNKRSGMSGLLRARQPVPSSLQTRSTITDPLARRRQRRQPNVARIVNRVNAQHQRHLCGVYPYFKHKTSSVTYDAAPQRSVAEGLSTSQIGPRARLWPVKRGGRILGYAVERARSI
jgi:hypothetical protein